ncbi:MAG: AcrR family transcriptional regulator [Ilumatobacter sp.]|jgi:AcrR family transcriptional regulator
MSIGLRERNRPPAMQQLKRVAFELIASHGFDARIDEQVTAASGVSPTTVYRYFDMKEASVLSSGGRGVWPR